MLIEYLVFGMLVVMALVATFVGLRRRRLDMPADDPSAAFPYTGEGTAGIEGGHHTGHVSLHSDGADGSGGAHCVGSEGGAGSHDGGNFEGGGGHHH